MPEKKILILFFHPRFENSRVNKRLVDVAHTLDHVTIRDMYELYPDHNIEVKTEQALLMEHDIIIWQHPFYWYSCPPLMKQWIDLVLEHGWAYGKDGTKLTGKCIMNVLSSGGTFEVYKKEGRNRFTYRELLSPFDQTAFLCNMTYLTPYIVPGANRITDEVLEDHAIRYLEILNFLQSPNVDTAKLATVAHFNDLNIGSWQETFYTTH
jgi:glutathione-regulated potassium-efflux system ancillary protein KefG